MNGNNIELHTTNFPHIHHKKIYKRKTRRNCLPAWIMRAHIPGGHFHYQAEGVEERKIKRGRKRDEEEEEEVNGIEFPMVYITSHDRGHYMFKRERERGTLSALKQKRARTTTKMRAASGYTHPCLFWWWVPIFL